MQKKPRGFLKAMLAQNMGVLCAGFCLGFFMGIEIVVSKIPTQVVVIETEDVSLRQEIQETDIQEAIEKLTELSKTIEKFLGRDHDSLGHVVVLKELLADPAVPWNHKEYYYRKWEKMMTRRENI